MTTFSIQMGVGQSTARRSAVTFLALATFYQLLSSPLDAATITVSNTDDDGGGSLRQAIQSAAAGDTINFSVTGMITLTAGELLVTNDLNILGPGAANLAISGDNNDRVFEVASNANVSISGLTIRDGHAPDGAVAHASGTNGGGIYNAGTLALTRCGISGNSAGNASMVYTNIYASGGRGGSGGGIYNLGDLNLTDCIVSDNAAGAGGVGPAGGAGGMGGGIHNAGNLVLLNCTLSGNGAGPGGNTVNALAGVAGGNGGAVYNAGSLTVTACTVSGNRAGVGGPNRFHGGDGGDGGGIYTASNSPLARLQNTLVALNSMGAGGRGNPLGGAGGNLGKGPNLFGSFASGGHNLVGLGSPDLNSFGFSAGLTNGVQGDLVGSIDPLLGPLQNNGGPTFTMALLAGSPAIDAGDDSLLDMPFNLVTDQRGYARKSGAHVDIGAFESQVPGAAPYVSSPVMLDNGAFGFAFASTPGASFTVLATTNLSLSLSNWTVLGSATEISPGQFQFTDSEATNNPQRYYQLRSP